MILLFPNNSVHLSSWRKQYIYALVISLIILILPFLPFLHLLFNPVHNQLSFLGSNIDHGYPSNQVFAWFLLTNLIYIFYLILLFLFSYGFWRYFIIPVIIHFIHYPLWMFVYEYNDYVSYLLSFNGIFFITLTILIIIFLDSLLKLKIYKYCIKPSLSEVWKEIVYSKNSKINREIVDTIKNKTRFSLKEYSCRLYYFHMIGDFNNKHSHNLISPSNSNKGKRFNYTLGIIIIFLTSLLFLHNLMPQEVKQVDVFGVKIGSFGFRDFPTLIYYTSQKLVMCLFMMIWFITSPFWWRWAILSPIIVYSYQFWEAFQPDSNVDGSGNLNVFPLVFLTILGVFLLSKVIRQISINLDYRKFLEEELDRSIGELSSSKKGG